MTDHASSNTEVSSTSPKIRVKLSISLPSGQQEIKEVKVSESDTIATIKSLHFADQLREGFAIRFFFQGRVLEDAQTFNSYCGTLKEGCVILAHVTRQTSNTAADLSLQRAAALGGTLPSNDPEENSSAFFYLSISGILLWVWYCRYRNPKYFDKYSETSMTIFTLVWITAVATFIVDRAKRLSRPPRSASPNGLQGGSRSTSTGESTHVAGGFETDAADADTTKTTALQQRIQMPQLSVSDMTHHESHPTSDAVCLTEPTDVLK